MSPSHDRDQNRSSRRTFLRSTGALAAGLALAQPSTARARGASVQQLALNGGPKAVTAPDTDAWRWPRYGKAEEEAVLAVVRKPSYDPLAGLEQDWKSYFGVDYCKAHCSGTAALTSMFFALDLPPGSEIMVPSYTFFATIVPMRNFGLVPVFVDINPRTLNFDLDDAKRRLTPNTRAVLPVHWFGNPCDMDAINDWAGERGLVVLEDAAHAHGAKLQGKWMGSWSRMAIFSYQMTKALPALEGGMGVYQEKDDFDRATAYGQYDQCSGKYEKYRGTGLGMKLRMHPVAASLARTQLAVLAERNAAGTAQVRRLNDRIVHLPGLYEQKTRSDCERMYYSTNMLFLNESEAGMSREKCLKALQAEGVHARAYNYRLQHKQPLYTDPQWWHHLPTIPELPGSEEANATSIALPYFTSEQPELVEQYVAAFEKVWAHRIELAG
jgi:dTDP-4-amino-4,6-dideoxygalactose transaminase